MSDKITPQNGPAWLIVMYVTYSALYGALLLWHTKCGKSSKKSALYFVLYQMRSRGTGLLYLSIVLGKINNFLSKFWRKIFLEIFTKSAEKC